MKSLDPKKIALNFNECINQQNLIELMKLMTEDHRFIDRAGKIVIGKEAITRAWCEFFKLFPEYRNTFERVESCENLVILHGFATWSKAEAPDYAIWTARIENGLVSEWRIY
jgi:predicted SnoaL-like aldol condensation-catalyzing enzyme